MIPPNPMPEHMTLLAEQGSLEDRHIAQTEPHVKAARPKTSSHTPFWLTKAALLVFVFIFTASGGSLLVLHLLIHANGGFPLTISSNEYLWTYGPTAVLVVILSLWRRIDYYYKSTQPWTELQSGPVHASRSLLLDYISPFQLQSMYRAFRFGHYRVTATIFSFFLLKAIILVSTTLFVVQNSFHSETFDITYQNTFDAAKIWTSPPYHPSTLGNYEVPIFLGGSDLSVWKYLARLNGAITNDSDWKTQGGLVSQQFRPGKSLMNITSLEGPVEVFVPNITCEEATLTAKALHESYDYVEYSWNSSTCSTGVAKFASLCTNIKTDAAFCGEKPWHYSFVRANCSRGIKKDKLSSIDLHNDIQDYDIRHVITAARYKVDTKVGQTNAARAMELIDQNALICKIGYSIASTNATHNLLSGDTTISTTSRKEGRAPIRNLTSSALAEILFTSLDKSSSALVANKTITVQTLNSNEKLMWGQSEALFQLMAAGLGDDFEPSMFLDSSVLKKTAIDVLGGLLNELARESLLINETSTGTAKGSVSEARLHTRAATVWAMTACYTLLAVICLLLLFNTSNKVSMHAFCGSIAGHATILTNSPILQDLLRNSGNYNENELVYLLNESRFKTTTNERGDMGVEMTHSVFLNTTKPQDTPKPTSHCRYFGGKDSLPTHHSYQGPNVKAWVPITGSLPFVIATFALPILAIGVLEFLQQMSNQRQGVMDIYETDSTSLSSAIRIASTAVAFTVATMFNSFDFTIATFAPYNALRSGNIQADRSILFHLLSVSPFLVATKTLRSGYFGAATSNISSLLGSFLTIAVSGLWILTGTSLIVEPSSVMVTNWHASWPIDSTDDGGAAVALNLIRNGGANASLGIWEDVVLPDIELSGSHTPTSDSIYQSSNYTYKVGALRPLLTCKAIPWRNFTSDLGPEGYSGVGAVQFHVQYDCGDAKVNRMADISFQLDRNGLTDELKTSVLPPARKWIGRYLDLNTTSDREVSECPSVGVLFGQIGGRDTSKWNITALACHQSIEQVPIRVTYQGNPTLRHINGASPPKLERDKAWQWTNKTSKSHRLGYRLRRFLTDDLAYFESNFELGTEFDSFFQQSLYGPDGMSKERLVGPANVGNLMRVVERNYAEYMRNVIDRNFRATKNTTAELVAAEAFPTEASPSSFKNKISGTSYAYGTRLTMNQTSKLILQILLAAMAILGLASYLLVKINGTLPRSPCSIASTMGFLAGSQLCDPSSGIIPQGAEYMNDKELKEVFDGWVFSLGWWHTQKSSEVQSSGSENVDVTESEQGDDAESNEEVVKRFGVDVGRANVAKL